MKKQSIVSWVSAGVGLGALALGVTGALILCTGMVKKEPDCDCVIVLGHRDRDGRLGPTMNERIARALAYLNHHPNTVAILSGGGAEAQYMFEKLTAGGIAENRLILEDQSTNTWQNLKYSLPLTEQKKVGILSSEFHLFRAKLYLKNRKVALISANTVDFPRWLFYFCREIAGVWHYILLGGTYDE